MSLSYQAFLADVAAVFCDEPGSQTFGSGRLIAPNLILTARHVVQPNASDAYAGGFKVRLIRERSPNGAWIGAPLNAQVAWCGTDLDLALLRIAGEQVSPSVEVVFSALQSADPLEDTGAAGFPRAGWDVDGSVREYSARGKLRVVHQSGSLAWTLDRADAPDKVTQWSGMSGASVTRASLRDRLHIFGVVQEVPANFSGGQLSVTSLADALSDEACKKAVADALGEPVRVIAWRQEYTKVELKAVGIDPALSDALNRQINASLQRNLKFRTAHVVASLLQTSTFVASCFNQADYDTARVLDDMVLSFLAYQPTSAAERGASEVRLDDLPIITTAKSLALEDDCAYIDERHLLLAFLRTPSGFLTTLRTKLGDGLLGSVEHTARHRQLDRNTTTDPRVFEMMEDGRYIVQ